MSLNKFPKHHSRYFHLVYTLDALREISGKVLDVGCGQGGITAAIKRQKDDLYLVGCDSDPKQLSRFRKNFANLGIKFVKCDAQNLLFENGEFDAILILDVLEHLKDPEKAVREVSRVVKRGGVFHLVVPLEAELSTFDGWIKKIFGKNLKRVPIGHIQQFRLRKVKSLLNTNGLKIQKIRYSYHFVYQLVSFIYYFYVSLVNKGEYLPLESGYRGANATINIVSKLVGWLVFFESSLLKNVAGQTAHITSKKL